MSLTSLHDAAPHLPHSIQTQRLIDIWYQFRRSRITYSHKHPHGESK